MDAEKVFDHADWPYLRPVLEAQGLGPHMLTWIMALYSAPSGQVKGEWGTLLPVLHQKWHEAGVPSLFPPFCLGT